LTIFDDGHAIDKHELNPFRVLQRIMYIALSFDASWIEHRMSASAPNESPLILNMGARFPTARPDQLILRSGGH